MTEEQNAYGQTEAKFNYADVPDPVKKQELTQAHQTDVTKVDGFNDGIDTDLLATPRIKLVQALSEEATNGTAQAGDFINTITAEIIANRGESFEFTPLMVTKSRIMFDNVAENGIACLSRDGKEGEGNPGGNCKNCEFSKWQKDNDGNNIQPCSEVVNFMVKLDEEPIPFVLSFMKSSFKVGRSLYNHVVMSALKKRPIYANRFKMSSKLVEGAKGSYYTPILSPAGINGNLTEYKLAYDIAMGQEIQIDESIKDEAPF